MSNLMKERVRLLLVLICISTVVSCTTRNKSSTEDIKTTYFDKSENITYSWETVETNRIDDEDVAVDLLPPDGGPNPSAYPVFHTENKELKASVNELNKIIKGLVKDYDYGVSHPDDLPENEGIFDYEVVVSNEHFVSILFAFSVCGNRCHEWLRSVNFDLTSGKRLSNDDLLSRMGIDPNEFRKTVRQDLDKFIVNSYIRDHRYPSFESIRLGEDGDSEETEYENRRLSDPEQLIKDASIVPVIYKNDLHLRTAIDIRGYNISKPGFRDFKWNEF